MLGANVGLGEDGRMKAEANEAMTERRVRRTPDNCGEGGERHGGSILEDLAYTEVEMLVCYTKRYSVVRSWSA